MRSWNDNVFFTGQIGRLIFRQLFVQLKNFVWWSRLNGAAGMITAHIIPLHSSDYKILSEITHLLKFWSNVFFLIYDAWNTLICILSIRIDRIEKRQDEHVTLEYLKGQTTRKKILSLSNCKWHDEQLLIEKIVISDKNDLQRAV